MKQFIFSLTLGVISLLPFVASAQQWSYLDTRSYAAGYGTHCVDELGYSIEMGLFSGTLTLGGFTLQTSGTADVYIGRRGPEGEWLWLNHLENWDGLSEFSTQFAPDGSVWVAIPVGESATYQGEPLGNTGSALALLRLSPIDGSLLDSQFIPAQYATPVLFITDSGHLVVTGVLGGAVGSFISIPNGASTTDVNASFIIMFDPTGELLWSDVTIGDPFVLIRVSSNFSDGSILCLLLYSGQQCQFLGEVFNAPQSVLTNNYYNHALLRIDQQGQVIWAQYPTAPSEEYLDMGRPAVDENDMIDLMVYPTGPLEFAGTQLDEATHTRMKLDGSGQGISIQPLDVSDALLGYDLTPLPDGGALVAGIYFGYEQPNIGQFQPPANATTEGPVLAKLNEDGTWEWAYFFICEYLYGGSARINEDGTYEIVMFVDGSVTLNNEVLYNGFGYQSLIIRFSPACMAVLVQDVEGSTCAQPLGGGIGLSVLGGAPPLSVAWNDGGTGLVRSGVGAGIYEAEVTDGDGCLVSKLVHVPGPTLVDSIDVVGSLMALGYFRPGVVTNALAVGFANGCAEEVVTMKVVLDPMVEYLSGLTGADEQVGDTLILLLGAMSDDIPVIQRNLAFSTSLAAQIGDTVCFEVLVGPFANDVNPSNDHHTVCFPVVNSYDPNDKRAIPSGTGPNGVIGVEVDKLDYLIRFQNTGNAEAFNIHIDDTLDAGLDLSRVHLIGASHACTMEILPGRVLRFNFQNINLPDSAANEIESHGYVLFEVPLAPSTTVGSVIHNTAHIYFDHNEAIVTNTTVNTIVSTVGMSDREQQDQRLILWPNPSASIIHLRRNSSEPSLVIITDVSGREVMRSTWVGSTTSVDITNLPSGLYFARCGGDTSSFLKIMQ
jgi:hypothetical protein